MKRIFQNLNGLYERTYDADLDLSRRKINQAH